MRAIVIGLGGMGRQAASLLKGLIMVENRALLENVKFVGIDVDPSSPEGEKLDKEIVISIRNVSKELQSLLRKDDYFTRWWIDNYIPHPPEDKIEGNTAANQVRIHGRLALYHNWDSVRNGIRNILDSFVEGVPYVFIITSLGGGTGSGIFIDIASLIKYLRPNITIFGFFLDGTITNKIVERGTTTHHTFLNSYAAIVELLHFLKSPNLYDFKGIELQDGLTIFDYCFLFQARTKKDTTFTSTDLNELKRNYLNLIAYNIYPILNIDDFPRSQIGNIYGNHHVTGEESEFNFHASASGRITISQRKIIEYIISHLAQKLLSTKRNINIEPFANTIEKDFYLDEKSKNALTASLNRDSKSHSKITETLEFIRRKMIDHASDDKVLKSLPNNHPLITKESEPSSLIKNFEEYENEMKAKIKGKLEGVRNAINKKIEEFTKQMSLDFDILIKWLEEAKNRIKINKGEIENRRKNKETSIDKLKKLPSYWQGIFKERAKTLFGVNPKRIDKVREYLIQYENYINLRKEEILYPMLIKFYEDLENFIDVKIKCFEILKDKLEKVKKEFENTKSRITWRDIPIDEYCIQNREYFLEMKIDLDKEIIEDYILPGVEKEVENRINNYLNSLWEGRTTQMPGLNYYIREIEDEIAKGRQLEINGYIVERIKELIKKIMEEDVKQKVNTYSIQETLKWWLEKKFFEEVKRYVNSNDEGGLVEFATRYERLFGERVRVLTDLKRFTEPDENKIKKEWIEDALCALLTNFRSYISPFIQYTIGENNNRRNELGLREGEHILNIIYSSQTGTFSSSEILDKLKYEGFTFQSVQLPSPSLWIICQEFQISPHVLSSYQSFEGFETKEKYGRHVESVRKALKERRFPERPYHVDKRFYNEWSSILGETKPEELIYWLIIISLGLEIIKRDERKKTKPFYYNNKKLGNTLPKTVRYLMENEAIRKDIKEKCKKEIEDIYIKNNRNYGKIEEIFKKSYDILEGLKAPTDKTADEMSKMVEYNPSGEKGINNIVPENYEKLMELLDKI